MPQPSALSLRALSKAQDAVAAGIKGGEPGWARFRGSPQPDGYQRDVGLPPPSDPNAIGVPWCIAALYSILKASEAPGEPSSCPRTASTIHCAEMAPAYCRLPGPRPGAVGILRHRDGVHGHAVMCELANDDGTVTTVEGDTNAAGSSRGDAWGRHENWDPASGARGTLLGWWDFGLTAPE
jgi:hypothetical protein